LATEGSQDNRMGVNHGGAYNLGSPAAGWQLIPQMGHLTTKAQQFPV
jgi:hypothetical protein